MPCPPLAPSRYARARHACSTASGRRGRFVACLACFGAAGCTSSHPLPYAGFVDEAVSSVAARTAGVVASIAVREGDAVKKGQVLARLDALHADPAETLVVSPFDGVVVSRNLEEGEWAAPGTPVVTVEDAAHPWVRLDVDESHFGGLAVGQGAEIHLVALPGTALRGHVAQIGAEGEFAISRDVRRGRPDVRTFLVRVALDEARTELRPGMTAEVTLGERAR